MAVYDSPSDALTHHSELIQELSAGLAEERRKRVECENELARLRDGKRMEELRRAVATRIQIGCGDKEVRWLQDALSRAEAYYAGHGLRIRSPGNITWVLTTGDHIPEGAFAAGCLSCDGPCDDETAQPTYVARAAVMENGIQVGRASADSLRGASFCFHGRERYEYIYEVLVTDAPSVRWVGASEDISLETLKNQPIESGGIEEVNENPLYIIQAYYAGAWRPGKRTHLPPANAFIPYKGEEVWVKVGVQYLSSFLSKLTESYGYLGLSDFVPCDEVTFK
ncbi:hypothetical protein EIP91_001243 [Steccherinum ochraceum]|uniref:Uncharacterized protein n=1 Tax=Steccherinum ochraceum TaxID=92696 RepID=A0A4R0RKV3_9APHY|nr:hypothetical protein EIP91_001243 [Steccherinum ochraceum]